MPLNENTYGNSSKTLERELVDPIYDLSDPSFAQKLNFQPHKPEQGHLENCKKIPRFHGFKTLSQAEMKERKRVQVPEWEFQDREHPFGGRTESIPVPIYKGSILEKRQQSLTGKETFDVYEIYTMWEEKDSKTQSTRLKEVVIRWDKFNGRVQLYALVYMVHPNKKAESGKFLETNGLVELSMVPHKDNPKKVATGGNWAGQGYWVPYVVALFYVRHWSYEYRYLFVFIWGNALPDTCKMPEQHGWRDNVLDCPVIAAARRESDYFLSKARDLIREPGQLGRKKAVHSNVLFTGTERMTVPSAREGRYHGPNTSQAFPLSSSLPKTSHHAEHVQSFPSSLSLGSHTGNSALLVSPGYYDPVREVRTYKLHKSLIQYSEFDKEHPQLRPAMDKRHLLVGVQKGGNGPISHQVQIDEWGKRKRCPDEVSPSLPRKRTEQQTEERDSAGNNRSPEGTYAQVHGAGKDWETQEHEAATALILLAGNELLGRAAITA
ncbi:hypothetical protein EV426DRAFT_710610 [Tirmania nivea]|nr:hypothetical protein EV426DRAFT_710610 [Tirmania nivea]